jgi:hypothetical protein
VAQTDPGALVQRMASAEKQNRRDAAFFVYREDIRASIAKSNQPARPANWVTYEVAFLEGEPYHRVVARNGKPLTPPEQEAEDNRFQQVSEYRRDTPTEERRRRHFAAEENRYKIDTEIVVRHHDATLVGADTIRGRAVWLVSTYPRRDAPKPKRRSEWSLCQKYTYWIDQKTHLPLRIEAEQLYDFDGTKKGTFSRVETVEVEGVLLPERILSTTRRKPGRGQSAQITDQSYSAYKRFRTETVLLFGDAVRSNPD